MILIHCAQTNTLKTATEAMAHELISLKEDPAEEVEEIPRNDLSEKPPVAIVTLRREGRGGTTLEVDSEEYNNDEMLRMFIAHLRACLEPAHHTWLRNKGWTDTDIIALDKMCQCRDTAKAVKEYQKASVEKK